MRIDDAYGDGICCGYGQGNYRLIDHLGNEVVSGGEFGASISHQFCVEDTPVNPPEEGPCPGNVLPDPGFETTGLTGWETSGRVKRVQNPNTGLYGVRLNKGEAQMSYTVNVQANDELNFCGFFKAKRNPTTAAMGIQFLDENFAQISTESRDIVSRQYEEYCISTVAPAGALFAKVFVYQNGGTSRLFADDLCLEGSISYRSSIANGFLDLQTVKKERSVEVSWAAKTRQYVKHYLIERSPDNLNFESIATYPVNTKSNSTLQYSILDPNPLKGTNYYRVKQVLIGDYQIHSSIRRVEFDIDFDEIVVFPNPAKENLLVDLRAFAGKSCTLMIANNLGIVSSQQEIDRIPESPLSIDLSSYKPGVYFISVLVEGRKMKTKSFVVIKDY